MPENLYCPRCGGKFTSEILFCRSCGLALDGVRDIVSGDDANAPEIVRRPNFAAFRLGVGLFIVGLVIGLINGALKDLELFPQVYGKMVFFAFIAAGLLSFGAGVAFPTKRYKKKKNLSEPTIGGLNTAPLASELTSAIHADISFPDRESLVSEPRSVTENTTRNLS